MPAAIYDIKACVRWVRANAATYQFDENAIGITGGSAGGHLSVLTAVTNHDSRFEGTANHLEFSSEINAVLSFYGPFAWLFKQALGEEMEGRISFKEALPEYHIKNGATFPSILCISENDRKSHKNWGEPTVRWIKENKTGEADFFILDAPHGYLNFSPFQEKAIDQRRLQIPEERFRAPGLGWHRGFPDEDGLADLVFISGATGPRFQVDRRRQTVTAFLVRTKLQKVVPLFTDLNQHVEQMFPVADGK